MSMSNGTDEYDEKTDGLRHESHDGGEKAGSLELPLGAEEDEGKNATSNAHPGVDHGRKSFFVTVALLLTTILCWGGGMAVYTVAVGLSDISWEATLIGVGIGATLGYLMVFLAHLRLSLRGSEPTLSKAQMWAEVRAHPWASLALATYTWQQVLGYICVNFMLNSVGMLLSTTNIVGMVCCLIPCMVYSVVVAKEPLTAGKVLGTAMVFVGCSLLGFNDAGTVDEAANINGTLMTSLCNTTLQNFSSGAEIGHRCGNADSNALISPLVNATLPAVLDVANGSHKAAEGVILVIITLLSWGGATITLTYPPKILPSHLLQDFLIMTGGWGVVAITTIIYYSSRDTDGALPNFELSIVCMVAGGMIITVCGNYAYMVMARRGAQGSLVAPLAMLYPIVGVIVGVATGDAMNAAASIGIAIVLISAVVLGREMKQAEAPQEPLPSAVSFRDAQVGARGDTVTSRLSPVLLY